MSTAGGQLRVFVTHSSIDKDVAEALVRALRLGTDLTSGQVFCSSIDGLDVPTGEDFVRYIREQLASTALVVPLVTPAYLDSLFCMWELGGAWVLEVPTAPLRAPTLSPDDLPTLLRNRNVKPLDTIGGLNDLAKKVELNLKTTINQSVWDSERSAFLANLPRLIADVQPRWSDTTLARQRRAATHAAAARHVHDALHSLRDAAYVIIRERPGENHASEFLAGLRRVAQAIAQMFSTTTGVTCRVTLKQVVESGQSGLSVRDLTRSTGLAISKTPDLISENTDFKSLLDGDEAVFTCGDLESLRAAGKYQNSHVPPGAPLPYASTVVWPIRKVLDDPSDAGDVGSVSDWQDLVGFLCVDATEKHVFDAADIHLGSGMADALYSVLRPYVFVNEASSDV